MRRDSVRYLIEDKKIRYLQSVGRLLPRRIEQILKELGLTEDSGYRIWINSKQGNDVDFKVWHRDSLILVGEILNWCIGSWLSEKRKRWIVSNLSQYDSKRVLIYTIMKREDLLKDLALHGISVFKIGYQLLPRLFYDYFAEIDRVIDRRIDCRETKQDIKSKIADLLNSLLILD